MSVFIYWWKFVFYIVLCSLWKVQSYSGLLGPSDQPEAYFNGSSYIRLQTTISLKRLIALSFKTCLGGELFSQQYNENLIQLTVNVEGVNFLAKTAGKQFEEKIKGAFLDNKWHIVSFHYRLGNLTMEVDGEVKLIANSTVRRELLTSPGVYNEGAILIVGNHYVGCMLEGPSIIFNESFIHNHNVQFSDCPISDDSCNSRNEMRPSKQTDFCITEPCMRHGTCINGDTTYSCVCTPRYTGKNCEMDIGSPCDSQPALCKNGAKCVEDMMGDFSCACAAGYAGKYCEQELSLQPLCATNPCRNGGACQISLNNKAECLCLQGFTGVKCEVNINDCQSAPCKHGGLCQDGFDNYTCDCRNTGYTGYNCDVNLNECLSNPCLHLGTCFDAYGGFLCQCPDGFEGSICQYISNVDECASQPCLNRGVCVDEPGGYYCNCLPGYTGLHCEIEPRQAKCEECPPYADCISSDNGWTCACKSDYSGIYPNCSMDGICGINPCKNGGVCIPWNGSYNCSCPKGFSGSACEHIDLCKQNTCYNGGTCIEDYYSTHCLCSDGWTGSFCERRLQCNDQPCVNAVSCGDYLGAFYCTCEPGWTGIHCGETLGHCYSEPCLNGATCIEQHHADFFSCICPPGFTGPQCQINENECASMPCQNDGICIDKINGFYCNCTDQWMGVTCETPYDACKLNPCQNNASCVTSSNKHDYICNCLPGFGGDKCQTNLDDCVNVSCPPGKVCVDLVSRYECRCPQGFAGDNCTIDVDPCFVKPCKNGASCVVDSTTMDYRCICGPGYTGADCETDINECELPGIPICNQGVCVNKEGSFQCYCLPGFTGERCDLDFDECLSMPCKNNATCWNKVNNYECACLPGYTGKDCHIDINECDSMPCRAGSTCIDGINEFTCICQIGLTGRLCDININDCEPPPCMNGAKCIDGLNSYQCNCTDTGYAGEHCEINIDECAGNPCINGAECIDQVKDYHCNCYPGYTGKNCEEDINECESNPCSYSGTCLEKSNMTLYHPSIVSKLNISLPESFNKPFSFADAAGYECLCVPGITGKNCEININECESSPCFSGVCRDHIGGYTCECDDGYEGEHCDIDINECEKYSPCVHGNCIDKTANYYCDCDPLYGGKNCSVRLTGCMDNPCLNDGLCKPYLVKENQHRFNCSCQNGFHGLTCEQVTTMSLSGHSSVTVNTTRDEGYDIQFRFKTTLGDGILALGRGVTYYILELSRGRLNLHTSLLNKWEGVFIGSNLNDSKWQKVFVAINSSHLVLSANDEQTIYPITFNENFNVSSTSFPTTYIGGIPSNVNLRKLTHGQPFLVGCTEDVLINGEWVLPEMQNASWLEFQDVEVGCHRKPQCNPNPCHSGGHCTDKWRAFSCTCERPYLGNTCQYNFTAATFGYENITDSLVTVEVADAARRAVRSIVDISMFIRTRQPRGQIFYLGSTLSSYNDETYIAAQLEGGELLMRIHFNGTTEAYTVGGVKLDNGYNHLIQVIRNVTLVQVKLNGTEYFRKTISATGSLDAQVLYLGGQPQLRPVRQAADNIAVLSKNDVSSSTGPAAVTASLSMVHFKGIIQDVQISNGSKVMVVEFFPLKIDELNIPMSFGNVSFDKNSVLEGVRSDNSCKINPCHHNGMCHNTWNDYRCECIRGFKGKDCMEQEFCELEHCPAQSECKNLEDGYECIANATFDGKMSPLLYNLTVLPNSTQEFYFDALELTYRTRSWGTALFAVYLENYFVVFIFHNWVVIQWRQNGVTDKRSFQRDHFDGQWLTVYLDVKDSILRGGFKDMVLDDSPNFEINNFNFEKVTEIFSKGTVYVAGSDNKNFDYRTLVADMNSTGAFSYGDATTDVALAGNSIEMHDGGTSGELPPLYRIDVNKSSDNFKGCLGEIRISHLLLPYFTTKELYPQNRYSEEFYELLSMESLEDLGCILCHEFDCFNGGQCADPSATYKCNCTVGYAADDCSVDINECEHNNCKNNATCVDEIGRYECKCQPGYEGLYCEREINECDSNPCYNGGTCNDGLAEFLCECPEDYVGKQCETLRLITCENEPCKNGATCQDGKNEITGNNFTCLCTEGIEGPLCDLPFCKRQHCENGFCNISSLVPRCQCQPGFDGKYCERNIDDCITDTGGSPCMNGGACIDDISRFDCNCTGTGYTGLLCENDINECETIRSVCGRGICNNIPGSFRCLCEGDKCGYQCVLDDPCKENPCQNGGQCQANCTDIADYICHCLDSFGGKNCTDEGVTSEKNDGEGINILYIVIPVVVVLVIVFAVAMAVVVNVARSKRATRGTYSPSAQEFCNPRVELDHVLKPPPEERLI